MEEKTYRIFKTTKGKVRKDGSRLTKSYGCDGTEHVVVSDLIWYNEEGHGVNGISNFKPPKFVEKCTHSVCKNFGFFTTIK